MTETREHRVEKRASERYALNGTAEGWSLFTVAHLCGQNNTMGGRERRKKREERGAQSGGMGVLKLGPLYSSTTELSERDNG